MANINDVITRARSVIGQIGYTMNAPHLTPNRNMLRNNVRHQGLFWADCSSYTRWCFDVLGVNIGDWTAPQSEAGTAVWSGFGNANAIPFNQLQAGDLIVGSTAQNFWQGVGAGGHVAISVGGRRVIGVNSANPNATEQDIVNEFGNGNWFWRIRRIGDWTAPQNPIPQPPSPPSGGYNFETVNQRFRVTASPILHRRRHPRTANSEIIERLPNGFEFTATRRVNNGESVNGNRNWLEVENSGWVSEAHVQKVQGGTPLAQNPPLQSNRPNFAVGQNLRTQVDGLRVRIAPGTNQRALTQLELTQNARANATNGMLNRGTAITVQEIRNIGADVWLRIPSGWIAGFFQNQIFVG
ncbi:MAG: C40 family peptidase [Lachnospiraceae bacterium]|nr:C40 family peptidase [Lachnospiraceae bacterium]